MKLDDVAFWHDSALNRWGGVGLLCPGTSCYDQNKDPDDLH
jgi:hypothetical protein